MADKAVPVVANIWEVGYQRGMELLFYKQNVNKTKKELRNSPLNVCIVKDKFVLF